MEEKAEVKANRMVTIVVTLDGVFGFIGVLSEASDSTAIYLENALTIGYDTDGTPFPTFGQLPVGSADPSKRMITCIPVSNVSYTVTMTEGDGHRIVEQYFSFFEVKPEDPAEAHQEEPVENQQ